MQNFKKIYWKVYEEVITQSLYPSMQKIALNDHVRKAVIL